MNLPPLPSLAQSADWDAAIKDYGRACAKAALNAALAEMLVESTPTGCNRAVRKLMDSL